MRIVDSNYCYSGTSLWIKEDLPVISWNRKPVSIIEEDVHHLPVHILQLTDSMCP